MNVAKLEIFLCLPNKFVFLHMAFPYSFVAVSRRAFYFLLASKPSGPRTVGVVLVVGVGGTLCPL